MKYSLLETNIIVYYQLIPTNALNITNHLGKSINLFESFEVKITQTSKTVLAYKY